MDLAALLAPVTVEAFLDEHWEKAPLLLQRGDPARFEGLLGLGDVEELLGSQTFRREDMRLVDSDTPLARPDYMIGDTVDSARVFALFQEGATVVFERLDHRWPPLRRLCRAMEQALGHGAQTNVYLTGGTRHGRRGESAQGLKRHYDTHDVFVLQLAGSKHWSLYDTPVELPVKAQQPRPEDYEGMAPRRVFDLEPGDLLYLPRGVVHDARATEETSLHVTLGILATTWGDLLAEAVRRAVLEDAGLRRALPPGAAGTRRGRAGAHVRGGDRAAAGLGRHGRGLAGAGREVRQRPGAAARRPVRPARGARWAGGPEPGGAAADGDPALRGSRGRDRRDPPARRARVSGLRRARGALCVDHAGL